jgi:hypothetical protein
MPWRENLYTHRVKLNFNLACSEISNFPHLLSLSMRARFYSRQHGFTAWFAALVSAAINIGFTALVVYGMSDYGIALFIFIPLLIGLYAVLLYGYKKTITYGQARDVTWMALCFFCLVLFFAAMEGLICIAMALPFGILLSFIGGMLGTVFVKLKTGGTTAGVILVTTALVPLISFAEKDIQPQVTSVTTSIEIEAPAEAVWQEVVVFPPLPSPDEFLFKAGIAYPTHATIQGKGVGAVRYCNFTTGSFVEPITAWSEPYLLAFDVKEQPAPMKELSFWNIDAPHLHDYFISKKGQFKLTRLPGNRTLLQGTTWYSHDIKPALYWKLWSTYIVHKIHNRVLQNIKLNAERTASVDENTKG